MEKFRTHYDNLKVSRNAPGSVIRAAYKTLMQEYHPDKFSGSDETEALRITKIIKLSFDVLIDPIKRAEHDEWIKAKEGSKNEKAEVGGETFNNTQHKSIEWPNDDCLYLEKEMYEIAAYELSSGNVSHGLMAKAVVEAKGEETKAVAKYFQLRIESLKDELLGYYLTRLSQLGCKITTKTSILGGKKSWVVTSRDGHTTEIKDPFELQVVILNCKANEERRLREAEEKVERKKKEDQDKLRESRYIEELEGLGCSVIRNKSNPALFKVRTKQKKTYDIERIDDFLEIIGSCQLIAQCYEELKRKNYDLEWNGAAWIAADIYGHKSIFTSLDDLAKFTFLGFS